jgi:4-methoxybenzoate monooxygenase (O-demethylating)
MIVMLRVSAVEPPVSDIDPFSAEFFENPFPAYEDLRDAGAVVRLARYDVWAAARYAEVRSMLKDWQTFCSGRGAGLTDFAKEEAWRPKSVVLEADPPLHDRTRGVLNRVLSASVIKRLRERFAHEANVLTDKLVERGSFDAIADLAEAYPLTVFPDAMGMPRENRHFLLPYSNMVFNSFGPCNQFFEEAVADARPVMAWMERQMQRDAFTPGSFGAEIHAAVDTGELSGEEASMTARSLLTAGVDTTVNGIGAAVYCLARFPKQFARLRADPSLARAAFDEALRYETPILFFFRTTTRATEIEGMALDEGEKVLMFLGSANRDPRHWERPNDYDITRHTVGHVAFGSGIHQCVGQFLARLEGECVLSALAHKVASIDITGPTRRRYNNTLRGLASLPVTVRPV